MDDTLARAFLVADLAVMLTDGAALVWLLVRRLISMQEGRKWT